MAELRAGELEELASDLRSLVRELGTQIASAAEGAKPVDLDEPIGRLSRMDAMQQQRMVQANRQAAQQRVAQAESALRRIDLGEYGECVGCGEEIGFQRLKARPETPLCLACQSRREARS